MAILTKISKQFKNQPFSVKQALKAGFSRREIQASYEARQIERVARGVYQSVESEFSEDDLLQSAVLRVGLPSAICLISALVHYHLTDIIPRKVWIMVPASKHTTHGDLKLLRTRSPAWQVGIIQENGFQVTSLERTIIDCFIYRRLVGVNTFLDALKMAIEQKRTSPGKILDMAIELKVDHRVRPYLEVYA